MGIGAYLKEIGRGRDGARALSREQAADLFGQVLDRSVSDLEIGAFCLAMRIKGETAQEMAGFLDATHARLRLIAGNGAPVVVIPSYNGARKLPALTALLALLLARENLPVLVHGSSTEASRVPTSKVLQALGIPARTATHAVEPGEVAFAPTALLCPGMQSLLDVRRLVRLRNPAHSLVKLMNPCAGPALLLSSYTHPEYLQSMGATFALMGANAMLLRGTEGEAVADPRRMPYTEGFIAGRRTLLQPAQSGTLAGVPDLPTGTDPASTADYIAEVMRGTISVPAPIARQVELVLHLVAQL